MEQESTEGLPVERHAENAAANEDFTGIVTRESAPRNEGGWDPYEVWRTRVRAPLAKAIKARTGKDRERDPLR